MLSVDDPSGDGNSSDDAALADAGQYAEQAVAALRPADGRGHLLGPGGNTYVAHCNHYNCFLQKTLRSRSDLGMDEVLVDVAGMLFFIAFVRGFDPDWDLEARLSYAEAFFRARGYGNPRITDAATQTTITATASHYSEGYRAKFGKQDEPQDFFLTGAIQGALMAAFGCDVDVSQRQCMAMGDDRNAWSFERKSNEQERIEDYLQEGHRLQDGRSAIAAPSKPDDLPAPPVTAAVRNMDLVGDPDEGLIPAFNVLLTFIPSLYYNVCSHVFLNRIRERNNDMSRRLGVRLLKEAGHVCGFYTLGNILLSSEYALLRKAHFGADAGRLPSMKALFGVVNAFGWGHWDLDSVTSNELRFTVHSSYEAYNYREYFGLADEPICYLHKGGGEAIMNALTYGNILHFGGPIDDDYVNRVFDTSDGFQAEEEQCFAQEGDGHACRLHVRP